MKQTIVLCMLGVLGLAAWAAAQDAKAPKKREVMVAARAEKPVNVDGKLDDAVWKNAKAYPLHLGDDAPDGARLQEGGEARLAWDDKYLYVAVKYYDSDIVAEGNENQTHHFETGDVAEVFIKPASNTCYWELYVTPHSKTSTYWFPGSGRAGLPSGFDYEMEIHVGGQCQGTFNNYQDKDTSWTGEMAIPIKELTRHGDKFGPGEKWTVLVARYNYGRWLKGTGPELSMTPKLPVTSYHLLEGYAELRLEKP